MWDRERSWATVVVNMISIVVAQLVDASGVGCATFAFGAKFPDFSLGVNTRDSQIVGLDVFPCCQCSADAWVCSPIDVSIRAVRWCRNRTIANEMVSLTTEAASTIQLSRRRSPIGHRSCIPIEELA